MKKSNCELKMSQLRQPETVAAFTAEVTTVRLDEAAFIRQCLDRVLALSSNQVFI